MMDIIYIHYSLKGKNTVTTISPETNFDCTIANDSDADIVLAVTEYAE